MSKRKRASYLVRPRIYKDGKQWCALLGSNIQAGIAGFGKTPAKALKAFDHSYRFASSAEIMNAKADWDENVDPRPKDPGMEERLAKALEALLQHPVTNEAQSHFSFRSAEMKVDDPLVAGRQLLEERRKLARTPAEAVAEGLPEPTVSQGEDNASPQELHHTWKPAVVDGRDAERCAWCSAVRFVDEAGGPV